MPDPVIKGWEGFSAAAAKGMPPTDAKKLDADHDAWVKTLPDPNTKAPFADPKVAEAAAKKLEENNVYFSQDGKGPNAQFSNSYTGEKFTVKITKDDLQKMLSQARAEAKAAGVTLPTPDDKDLFTPEEQKLAPPNDYMIFEGAETAIQYMKARWMMERGAFGGPPPDPARFPNMHEQMEELRKKSPGDAKQFIEQKVLQDASAKANDSIEAFAKNPHPDAKLQPNDLSRSFNTIAYNVTRRRILQNSDLVDAFLNSTTAGPGGTPVNLVAVSKDDPKFALNQDGKADPNENFGAKLTALRDDKNFQLELKAKQAEFKKKHAEEAQAKKEAKFEKDMGPAVTQLQELIAKQNHAADQFANPDQGEKYRPRTLYSMWEATQLMTAFNEAKEAILAKAADVKSGGSDVRRTEAEGILRDHFEKMQHQHALMMRGDFKVSEWNALFKETRKKLEDAKLSTGSLDNLQEKALQDQMGKYAESLKHKAGETRSAACRQAILREQHKKVDPPTWGEYFKSKLPIQDRYTIEYTKKMEESGTLSKFDRFRAFIGSKEGMDQKAKVDTAKRSMGGRQGVFYFTDLSDDEKKKVEGEFSKDEVLAVTEQGAGSYRTDYLRGGVLRRPYSPFDVLVKEHEDQHGEKTYSFHARYDSKKGEAREAYLEVFKAMKSIPPGATGVEVKCHTDPVLLKDILGILQAAHAERLSVDLDKKVFEHQPRNDEERRLLDAIIRERDDCNRAAKEAQKESKEKRPDKSIQDSVNEHNLKHIDKLQKKIEKSYADISELPADLSKEKDIPAQLKKAEEVLASLDKHLNEAKEQFARLDHAYNKLNEEHKDLDTKFKLAEAEHKQEMKKGPPPPPGADPAKLDALEKQMTEYKAKTEVLEKQRKPFKSQIQATLDAVAELSYSKDQAKEKLDDYLVKPPLDDLKHADRKQADELSKKAAKLDTSMREFDDNVMKKSHLEKEGLTDAKVLTRKGEEIAAKKAVGLKHS